MDTASNTYPVIVGSIKKNSHVVINNCPCKVVDLSISKTGKHGHAKAHIIALDIFTGQKHEQIKTTSKTLHVPIVDRFEYQLTDINSDDYVCLMDEKGIIREDLKLPTGELGTSIKKSFDQDLSIDVVVLSSMGHNQIMDFKIIK